MFAYIKLNFVNLTLNYGRTIDLYLQCSLGLMYNVILGGEWQSQDKSTTLKEIIIWRSLEEASMGKH